MDIIIALYGIVYVIIAWIGAHYLEIVLTLALLALWRIEGSLFRLEQWVFKQGAGAF